MALGEPDVDAMLADLAAAGGAVAVTLGGTTVMGALDRESAEILGSPMPGVNAVEDVVHVARGSVPGLAAGSALTVDGVARIARVVEPYGDGALTRIVLRRP